MKDFKDLFSTQASDYARFRPKYPPSLYDYLAGIAPARGLAWDVGTGNGHAEQRKPCVGAELAG